MHQHKRFLTPFFRWRHNLTSARKSIDEALASPIRVFPNPAAQRHFRNDSGTRPADAVQYRTRTGA